MKELSHIKVETTAYTDLKNGVIGCMKAIEDLQDQIDQGIDVEANIEAIKIVQDAMADLQDQMFEMESKGTHIVPGGMSDEYAELLDALAGEKAAFQDLIVDIGLKAGMKLGSMVAEGAKRTLGLINNIAGTIGKSIYKYGLQPVTAALSGISSKLLGMVRDVSIFKAISQGFDLISEGANKAFGEYIKADTSLKTAIDNLKASATGIGAQLVSAFGPIISIVVPYIQTLVSWLTTAANALSALIAALTGASSYKKAAVAIDSVGAAAGGAAGNASKLNKELQKLAKYDELTVISPSNSGGGGGGGGGAAGSGITYSDETIGGSIANLADRLKASWETADFTWLGEELGDKINDALYAIPWDKIQDTAGKVGKSLATFLNGAIGKTDFKAIGSTLANFINTGVNFAYEFVTNFDFKKFGTQIGNLLNGAIRTFDYKKTGETISNLIIGGLDALKNIASTFDWAGFGDKVVGAIKSIKWGEILKSAADLIVTTLAGLMDFSDTVLTRIFGSDYENMTLDLQLMTKELANSNDELQRRLEKAREWRTAGDEYTYAGELMEQYEELEKKHSLSNEEREKEQKIAKELVDYYPELKQFYNDETGLLENTDGAVTKYIESLKEKARVEAAQSSLKILTDQQDAYNKQLIAAREELAENKKHHDDLNRTIQEGEEGLAILGNRTDENAAMWDYWTISVANAIQEQYENARAIEEGEISIANLEETMAEAKGEIDALTSYIENGIEPAKQYAEAYGELGSVLDNLPATKRVEVEAILNDDSLSMNEKQIKVIAAITGLNEDQLRQDQRLVNDLWGELTGVKNNLTNDQRTVSVWAAYNSFKNNLTEGMRTISTWAAYNSRKDNLTDAQKTIGVKANATTMLIASTLSRIIPNVKGEVNRVEKQPGATLQLAGIIGIIGSVAAAFKASGGVYQNGTWSSIPQFATGGIMGALGRIAEFAGGGLPRHGSLYIAGEAGSEIVGNIGGRTEVLNRSQIASAIYSAVVAGISTMIPKLESMKFALEPIPASAMMANYGGGFSLAEALRDVTIENHIDLNNQMSLDGRVVYSEMVQIDQQTVKQTGMSGFGGMR